MFCPFLFLCPSSRHCLSWGSLTLCKLVLILPPPSKGLVQVCSRFLLPPASPCSHLASALPILLQRPENPALLLLEDLSGSGASSAALLACSAFGLLQLRLRCFHLFVPFWSSFLLVSTDFVPSRLPPHTLACPAALGAPYFRSLLHTDLRATGLLCQIIDSVS